MKICDIKQSRLQELNEGRAATTHLSECLAVDFVELMKNVMPMRAMLLQSCCEMEVTTGIIKRMALAANILLEEGDKNLWQELLMHPSDTVRGWACFMIGQKKTMTLQQRLKNIHKLADDPHFGVREWAWLALRPHIIAESENALILLQGWTQSPSAYIRRFASEATRPRGVWCAHFEIMKSEPQKALGILQPLKADPHRYVQDSVGNWLNDAAKTRPDWVYDLCQTWLSTDHDPATVYICKRAMRSLKL